MSDQQTTEMRRDFASRDDLIAYLRDQFPQAVERDSHVSPTIGGRAAAKALLQQVEPVRYEKTRNWLKGAVTRLSAYIRHGVMTLAQIRDDVLGKTRQPIEAEKLINELAWRDYWQRLYDQLGDQIWQDREPYKTGLKAVQYSDALAPDIADGTTELVCIDSFSRELRETGYLHNHQRLWLAAYIVHWRHIRWQAGARWFLSHLLDGDPASNNLSWQWVASTFSGKPYIFNRENLERFTEGVYCKVCPLYRRCPMEGSYEALERRLFPKAEWLPKISSSYRPGGRGKGNRR